MLEKLVHGSGRLPPNQHYIEILLPNGLSYEVLNIAHLPRWDDAVPSASKTYGETWQQAHRSAILIVPSVVARVDRNVLINPDHPEFPQITHGLHYPVWWDLRLYGSAP
jgi:RES domain-containing protein